ncbi:MAG: extracellular solute-binding protein [Spirochaetaceae bacterium]|nr:extracellular solute-binding protein [Spirochaetaceae bacterium]
MKKGIIALLMIALVASAVMAQKTTLNVLYYIDATQAGYAEDLAIWEKFKADNPDIELVKEDLFSEPFHQKMQAYIAAGTLPDLFYMWPSGRSQAIYEKHLAKDLSKLMGADFMKNFAATATNPKALGDPITPASQYQAIVPQAFTLTTAVYVNKKLLADNGFAIPKTYAELKKMVPKLKAKGIAVMMLPNKDLWPAQSCLFSTISGRMVGDSFIDAVKVKKAKFTDKAFVAALEFYQNLFKDGIIAAEDMNIGYSEGPGIFAAGKAAMYIDGDWRGGAYITDKASGIALIDPKAQESGFDVINFPAIPGEKNPGIVSGIAGVGYGINEALPAGSAKEKAAVRLMQYLYSSGVQKIRFETGAYIPTLKGVTGNVEPYINKMAAYKNAVPKTSYVLDGVLDPSVFNILNNGLQGLGLGTAKPAVIAADMQKAMDAFLAAKK